MMRLASLLLIAMLPIGVTSAAPPPPQSADGPEAADAALSQEARTLRHRGMKAQSERDYRTAYAAYTAAWNVSKSYALAANLGFVELKLERYREAAEHLAYALREAPKVEKDQDRPLVEKDLAEAKKHIGTVSFVVSPNDAYLIVNGKEIGKASTLQSIFLDPGQVVFEARHGDRHSERRELKIEAGSALEVRITVPEQTPSVVRGRLDANSHSDQDPIASRSLSQSPEANGPANSVNPNERDRTVGGPRLPIILAGAGIAVAGLIVGLAEGAVANSAATDRDSAVRALPQESPCAPEGPGKYLSGCTTVSDADQRWQTARNLSVAGYITGGIAAAGTLAYFFLTRPTRTTSASITPVVGPNQAHLLLRSEF